MPHEPDGVIDFGATPITVFTTSSGNANVDGLLAGAKWTNRDLTFSFPSVASDYDSGGYADFNDHEATFSSFTAKQRTAAHYWIGQFAAVSGLTFTELDGAPGDQDEDQEATLRFANSNVPGTAFAYEMSDDPEGGDMCFNNAGNFPDRGDYDWHTIGQELGHAVGLNHGHEAGGISGAMNANRDSQEFSIMTYRSFVGGPTDGYTLGANDYPQTLMMYDIRALQERYGANFSTNSGATTYSFSTTTGEMSIDGSGRARRTATASSSPSGTATASTPTNSRTTRPTSRSTCDPASGPISTSAATPSARCSAPARPPAAMSSTPSSTTAMPAR